MSSSAPQKAKRTCRCSLLVYFNAASCSAISRIVADPLPLSLIPGPVAHRVEVRADHNGLALDLAFRCVGDDIDGLVDSRSFSVDVKTRAVTGPSPQRPGVQGLTIGKAEPDRRCRLRATQRAYVSSSSRPGWPSLKIITAA